MIQNRFVRFITRLFERRSFKNQQWLQDWLRGKDYGINSYAGVKISSESAIRNSAVFACGKLLSETIASLPLFTYKRLPNGKEKATDHSLYNILHLQPNELMTSFIFREMMMWHLLFWGNSYSNIIMNNGGDVIALWPLLPWRMDPKWKNGKIVYKYRLPDNTETIIPNEYVLHIPGMSFDGLVGKSVLSCAREAVGLSMALEEFGARFFGQGAQFGGIISHPKVLGEKAEANLRAALKEKYQGIANAHRILILEEAMEYKQNTIPPNDAQFLESRKFETAEIARFFNVPLHLIHDLERATFDNIEEMGIGFVVYSLRPWLIRIEQSETIKLLTTEEKKIYFIEHLIDGLLRGKIQARYEAYAIGKQWGWLSSDDIRALENQNPLPDGQGKIYWMPLNMIDASQAGNPLPQMELQESSLNEVEKNKLEIRAVRSATLKSRIANNYRGLFEETATRIIKFERTNVLKAAKSIFKKRSASILNFNDFLNEFYQDKYDEINKRSKPPINTYGKVISSAISEEISSEIDSIKLDKFMDEYTEAFNRRYIGTSKSRLTDTVQNAIDKNLDPYKAVEDKFNQWEQTRPQTISIKETIKIAGAVSLFTYSMAGIQRVIWINTGSKSCPFCESLNGKVMGIEQPFMLKSDLMEAEGKESLTFSSNIFHPPLHGGCVCQLSPG